MSEQQSWWQLVGVPAVIASVPGGIAVWQWWVNRADKAAEQKRRVEMTIAERQQSALAAEREALTKGQRDLLEQVEAQRDRAEAEATRERTRRLDVERDRDRVYNLARLLHRYGRDAIHAAANARQVADDQTRRLNMSTVEWHPLPVIPLNMEEMP